jgi:hypothetical protein
MVEIEMMGMVGGDVDLKGVVAGYPRIFYVEELGDCDQRSSRNTLKLYKGVTRILYIDKVRVKVKFTL